jgi:hypothetical protein
MKTIQGTEAACDAARATIDTALSLPARGTVVGSGAIQFVPAPSWNGTGQTPVGWTKTYAAIYVASAADAWLPCDDTIPPLVASSGLVTAPNKATFAASAAVRPDVPDPSQGGTRIPKANAVAVIEAVTAEEVIP